MSAIILQYGRRRHTERKSITVYTAQYAEFAT